MEELVFIGNVCFHCVVRKVGGLHRGTHINTLDEGES